MKPSEPQFAKCVCQNCPGHIEFEVTRAGETVSCPHCGLETRLYVPPIPLTSRGQPANQTEPRPEPTKEPEPRPEAAKTQQPEKPSSEQPHQFYFYKSQDGEKGPYTDAQLRSLWVNGHITADAVYRSDKSSDWVPLYDSPIVKPAQLAGRIPPLRAVQQWMFKAISLLSVVAFFLANVHISVPIVGKMDFSMFGFLVPHSRSPSTEQEIRKPNISDLVTSLFQSENGFEFNSVTTGWVVCGVAVLGLALHYLLTLVWATVRLGFKRSFSLLNIVWLVLAIQFPILFSAGAHAVLSGATRQTANELEDNPFGVLGIAFVNNVTMTPGVIMWLLMVLCLAALALPFVARKMSLPWEAPAPEAKPTPNPRFKILPVWGALLNGFSQFLATDAARKIRFLDITGLALGIISCSLLWIPWINSLAIPLAAIGLLLALAGVLVRRKTQRTGHVLPICTGIVCVASVLAALFIMPTHLFGQVLVVNNEGQDQRLSAVEISLVKKNTILAALEAKRQEIAARSAERRELEAALAATARAQETYDQLRTTRPQSTNAEYMSTQAELERALQEVEATTQAAQSWRTRNAQLQAAATSAVRRRTTRSSRDSSTLSYLEATANAIFQSGTMGVPRSGLGGPNVIRLAPPAGEIRELAEWRAFLQSAPEGLRIIADKAAENRRTVRELEAKLRRLGNNALADAGAQLESAKSRERAAKLQVDRLPSAEELLAGFQPTTVKTTQTDASGAFLLSYQPNAAYAIFAKARNSEAEEYYWLVAAPSGRGTARLQLSGENVARLDAGGHVQVLETPNSDSGNSVVQGWSKSRTVKQGSISVTVAGASVGQVCYRDIVGRPQFTGPHLTMTLCVSNLSTAKKVDFETWRGSEFGLGNEAAILSDNLGNKYKRISVTPAPNLLDPAPDNASIHPHKAFYDHVVFEVPLQNATSLRLELPAKNFGGKGTVRLEIPANLVK